MPSPFPGMDPYLEGYLWPDVHSALASKIRQQLTPKLRPHYAARLEIYMVEDRFPESEIGILYPDVEVTRSQESMGGTAAEPLSAAAVITPARLTIPLLQPVLQKLVSVEIRDTAHNRLVTCIEILSPVNKREPGLLAYRQKRQRLYQADVHLLELDLLRRGTRPFAHPQLPAVPYAIALTRAQSAATDIWPLQISDPLPVLPIPLQAPDPDVPMDLSAAMTEIYDEAAYDLSVNYAESPPPPSFSAVDQTWMEQWLNGSS